MLKKLQTTTDSSNLTAEEKRVWDYFQKVPGKRKFLDATTKTRLRFQLGQRDRIVQGIFFSGRYLEDFESSNGNWYTAGNNGSWQWGTPAKTIISALVFAAC